LPNGKTGTDVSPSKKRTKYEKDLYFYHPDHLGSSSYVTDLNGKLYEHLQYFPFGESWIEENSNVQRTPYLFTAKELDEETGLYYFGARYYDPRTSVWQSADPILDEYLPSEEKHHEVTAGLPKSLQPNGEELLRGMGGVFNPVNLGLYTYAANNPVLYVDPDGKSWLKLLLKQFGKQEAKETAKQGAKETAKQELKREAKQEAKEAKGDSFARKTNCRASEKARRF
jgi:RHS repeat-associated protein